MPLVTFCGTPLSGKSNRAQQLYDYCRQYHPACNVVLVSDEDKIVEFGGRDVVYSNANVEKRLRGWLKSEVGRHLASKETIVILDAANYIKGYRYELNCLVKESATTQAVVECEAPETVDEDNFLAEGIEDPKKYSRALFAELIQRYEEPNGSSRWDSPLFRIASEEVAPAFEKIIAAVLAGKPSKPNKSTQSQPLTTDNYLQELDNQTQAVIRQIQLSQEGGQLTGIRMPDCPIAIDLERPMSMAELNKFRRQFINYQKVSQTPASDRKRLTTAFVQFINKSVQM